MLIYGYWTLNIYIIIIITMFENSSVDLKVDYVPVINGCAYATPINQLFNDASIAV